VDNQPDLKSLYLEAQSALKARDYDRTVGLLKQILIVDENYRDASHLLAQAVKLKRRRWYDDMRIWWPVIGVVVITLLAWLVPKISLPARVVPMASASTNPTKTLTKTPRPTATLIPTLTPSPTSKDIPVTWKRISVGKEFSRDQVTAIVFDPQDPDVVYVGLQNAGVYKSIDGALSWRPAHNGLSPTGISSLVINPTDPKVLYAGNQSGVFITRDGGASWEILHGEPTCNDTTLILDPLNSQHLYFTDSCGMALLETNDGGLRWARYSPTCPEAFDSLSVDPQDARIMWAIDPSKASRDRCTDGIYRSMDNGETWDLVLSETNATHYYRWVFTNGQSKGSVFVNSGDRLQVSSDGGETWNFVGEEGSMPACTSIVVDPADKNTMYCGREEAGLSMLWKTENGGKNWQHISSLQMGTISALTISPADSQVILVGGQGLAIASNGGSTLETMNNGLGGRLIELEINPANNAELYAHEGPCSGSSFHPLFRSEDSGKTWSVLPGASYEFACGLAIDVDGYGLYRFAAQSVLRSGDNGRTWELVTPFDGTWIIGIAANPYQAGQLYANTQNSLSDSEAVLRSTDHGNNWSRTDLSSNHNWGSFAFASNQGQTVYMIGNLMYRSVDGGINWEQCGYMDVFMYDRPTPLIVDPSSSIRLFLGLRGEGIYMSNDGCASWRTSNTGLGSLFVNSIAIDPNNPDTLYVGTDGGAYVSFDFGQTWGQINDGLLGAMVVYSIVVDKDSNVYAATPYGIFKLERR
jgi:photosystem II stability/assembly factor-like uncharacterized protein